MDPAVLGRPVLRFDDAIAMAKGDDSFITHLTGDKLKFFDAIYFVNKSPYGVYAQTLKILEPDELASRTRLGVSRKPLTCLQGAKQKSAISPPRRAVFLHSTRIADIAITRAVNGTG